MLYLIAQAAPPYMRSWVC